MRLREAVEGDRPFLVEMARHADAICSPDADIVVVATDERDRPIGAAWCGLRERPLRTNAHGDPLPELAMAVAPGERGRGVGSALLDALLERAGDRFPELTLNVHVQNPAVLLYQRAGFLSDGPGRGPLGVAMRRARR